MKAKVEAFLWDIIPFLILFTQIVFIAAKLAQVIVWSWWLVMVPLLITASAFLALMFYAVYIYAKSHKEM